MSSKLAKLEQMVADLEAALDPTPDFYVVYSNKGVDDLARFKRDYDCSPDDLPANALLIERRVFTDPRSVGRANNVNGSRADDAMGMQR